MTYTESEEIRESEALRVEHGDRDAELRDGEVRGSDTDLGCSSEGAEMLWDRGIHGLGQHHHFFRRERSRLVLPFNCDRLWPWRAQSCSRKGCDEDPHGRLPR